MRIFGFLDVVEAIAYANEGKIALHVHNVCFDRSPRCFREAVRTRKECIGHLFDQDKDRLVSKAKSLGVSVIYIDAEDERDQHIDLCGTPMRKAIQEHYHKLLTLGKTEQIKKLRDIVSDYPGSAKWI